MRTEKEIRERLNAISMDIENPEKAHVSPDKMAMMVPYIHALEWVLDDRTKADENNEPYETVNADIKDIDKYNPTDVDRTCY